MASDEFRTRCGTLIRSMGKTLSGLSLYTMKHPSVAGAIVDNHSALEILLRESGGELTLSIDKDTLLANGQVAAGSGQVPSAILNFFKRYELHGVTFLPGVSVEELTAFFEALTLKPEALQGKTLMEYLESRGVRQIRPNASVYMKVEKSKEGDAAVQVPGAGSGTGTGGGDGAPGTGGGGSGGAEGGLDWAQMPLDAAITTLTTRSFPDPVERARVHAIVQERIRQDLEKRINEATVVLRTEKGKLTHEKQRTDVVLNNMSEAVVVVDDGGNVLLMNPAAEQLYGKKLADMAGKPLVSAVKADEQMIALAENITTTADPIENKLLAVGEENASRAMKASTAVVRNAEGAVVGMVSGLPDAAKFREYQRLQDEFIAQVTHELRSPLTSITAALSLLADQFAGKLNSDQDRVLHLAVRNADRLAGLINEMLDFSKLQAGQMTVHPVPLNVPKQVKEAVESLEPWAKRQNLTLKVETSEALPQVFGDPKRLTQVIVNLLSNAIKFAPKGSSIEIGAAKDPEDAGFIRFAITDHGAGMSKADQGKLFEKFVQLMAGERQAQGTGLGLSIAKALVHLQKGRIWVDSTVGKGTTFFFTLLVFRPEMIGDMPKKVAAPPPPPPKSFLQRLFGG